VSRPHILFVSVQGHGHVYPSLGVVRELVDRGHRVTYLTTPLFADDVKAVGAEVAHYRSVFDDVHVPDMVRMDDAEAQLHLIYLRENIAILEAAAAACDDDIPDLIVYDVFPFIAGRLLATKWGRPAVRLWPIFAANEHYSIFEALWASAGLRHPADVPAFQPRMAALLADYGIDTPIREFWDAIEDLNIVFIPRSFQIAGESFDDRFVFVGPSFSERLPRECRSPDPEQPIALVSLGNTFNEHPEFFRACAEAFAGTPWHVVMAIGKFLDPAAVGVLPPNVEAHRWVSFLDVLPRASVFITQGTTGAVMEALSWGCPLVVVPHFASEAVPSAERVIALGLGYHLGLDPTDPRAIYDTARRAAADAALKRRVRQVQAEIRGAGGPRLAAEAMETFLAMTPGRGSARSGVRLAS
jgi:MGT family glycosyltransferase